MEADEVTVRPIWTGGRKSAFGWALYDWANSPFTTVVTTFIFAAYFAAAIAPDKTTGASQWAFTQGAAACAREALVAWPTSGPWLSPWPACRNMVRSYRGDESAGTSDCSGSKERVRFRRTL